MRHYFRSAGQVSVDRSSSTAARDALQAGVQVLSSGNVLGIHPEGTRSPDGRLYKGKTGVARLALRAKVPVIPAAILNTDYIQPIGRVVPRIAQVKIRIGKPLDFSEYADKAGDLQTERAVTDQIMSAIQELSGQEYVDTYASSVKAKKANK